LSRGKIEQDERLQVKYFSPQPSNKFKMSFTVSPFVSALPLPHHLLFEYDEDGDVIMTDATTGERIMYGYGRQRSQSTGTLVASPVAEAPSPVPVCPPAPPRSRAPVAAAEDSEEEGDAVARNLAQEMAEAVLDGEPREEAPPAGEPAPAGVPEPAAAAPEPDAEEWCVSVTVSDLALRLDMRHPRVLLNLLRFVDTYNELAPYGEEIHLPLIPQDRADHILAHESVVNPPPEFADQVAELRALVERYTEVPSEDDGYHSDDSYYSRGY
jgi:hypothetical protein